MSSLAQDEHNPLPNVLWSGRINTKGLDRWISEEIDTDLYEGVKMELNPVIKKFIYVTPQI